MSVTTTSHTPTLQERLRGKGGHADRSFRGVVYVSGFVVLAVLALIALTMFDKSRAALSHMGLDFFTSKRWNPPGEQYGVLSYIWGTVYTSVIALVLAVPVSLGIAIYITQVAPNWLRKVMTYVIDLLAVVPSVVFGLWGILVFAPHVLGFYKWLSRTFDGWPVLGNIFGPNPQGRTFFTAGIILAIMIIPIIVSISREVMETTPQTEKEAALGLGATKWEMITGAVLPHSRGGLVGAVMLGLGRAMGETIAVALVIGSATGQITLNALTSGNSMPAVITAEWGEADTLKKSALIAMAMTLFVMTIVVNMTATAVVNRSQKRMGVR
ncbi:MAG: phosphate ABC transporter permease subunit PstC [Acidimicrobiaceae bacterium]|nr:phosphate ABC transporter permease subunit PstC [Acidimicrobiaceae bacterium]